VLSKSVFFCLNDVPLNILKYCRKAELEREAH
jgi:hypothetical protein